MYNEKKRTHDLNFAAHGGDAASTQCGVVWVGVMFGLAKVGLWLGVWDGPGIL